MKYIAWVLILLVAWAGLQSINRGEPPPPIVKIKEPARLDLERHRLGSIAYLNQLREAAGMVALDRQEALERSATNHALYIVSNDKVSHDETQGDAHFTGAKPADRAIHAGYSNSYVLENISGGSRGSKESIDELFSAIYHRFGFLDFQIDEIGAGVAQSDTNGRKTTFVYNMGIASLNELCQKRSFGGSGKYIYGVCADREFKIKERTFKKAVEHNKIFNNKIVIYPYDGQSDVPPAFFDEIPDPLPNHRVSGFPVSISFNKAYFDHVELISFELFDASNNQISDILLLDQSSDPNSKLKKFEFALLPLERLQWDSDYHVQVEYYVDGTKEQKSWHFHTRSFDEPIYEVTPQNNTFEISKNSSAIFYFKPLSKVDVIEKFTYPDRLDVTLIDKNTIKITTSDRLKSLTKLKFGDHTLTLQAAN